MVALAESETAHVYGGVPPDALNCKESPFTNCCVPPGETLIVASCVTVAYPVTVLAGRSSLKIRFWKPIVEPPYVDSVAFRRTKTNVPEPLIADIPAKETETLPANVENSGEAEARIVPATITSVAVHKFWLNVTVSCPEVIPRPVTSVVWIGRSRN